MRILIYPWEAPAGIGLHGRSLSSRQLKSPGQHPTARRPRWRRQAYAGPPQPSQPPHRPTPAARESTSEAVALTTYPLDFDLGPAVSETQPARCLFRIRSILWSYPPLVPSMRPKLFANSQT